MVSLIFSLSSWILDLLPITVFQCVCGAKIAPLKIFVGHQCFIMTDGFFYQLIICRLMRKLFLGEDFWLQNSTHVLKFMNFLNVSCMFWVVLYILSFFFGKMLLTSIYSVEVCILLFSHELHRQLSSVGKSWHVSVM